MLKRNEYYYCQQLYDRYGWCCTLLGVRREGGGLHYFISILSCSYTFCERKKITLV